jgi:hypothetical protein
MSEDNTSLPADLQLAKLLRTSTGSGECHEQQHGSEESRFDPKHGAAVRPYDEKSYSVTSQQ